MMGTETTIEWTDHTWSPWHGCAHAILSDGTEHPGCANCYAEKMAKRNTRTLGEWGPGGTRILTVASSWESMRKLNAKAEKAGVRTRVFPSICDPFEGWKGLIHDSKGKPLFRCKGCGWIGSESHPNCTGFTNPLSLDDVRRQLFALIDATPWLTWQLLTKRPGNVRRMWRTKDDSPCRDGQDNVSHDYLGERCLRCDGSRRHNVHLYTSVSDQATADELIPELLRCRHLVPVLGVSLEPMLGPVDLTKWLWGREKPCDGCPRDADCECGFNTRKQNGEPSIDHVIVGGESGPHARPMHPQWVRDVRDQCVAAELPFFFKQHGEWLASDFCTDEQASITGKQSAYVRHDGSVHDGSEGVNFFGGDEQVVRVGKKLAGRLLDGAEWNEVPEINPEKGQA